VGQENHRRQQVIIITLHIQDDTKQGEALALPLFFPTSRVCIFAKTTIWLRHLRPQATARLPSGQISANFDAINFYENLYLKKIRIRLKSGENIGHFILRQLRFIAAGDIRSA
jgi:hypothetical protein